MFRFRPERRRLRLQAECRPPDSAKIITAENNDSFDYALAA
ncbi:hypothetical protein TPE_0002 [Treponema pedis str. T A4]|uniref:Uncharacterized protein n=6 Tax=Treponema TaxID=157 RepID=S5ZR48_9SPIR|nr:hypothetical protein TPE_0002 [Treponema pedis str. T A4]